MRLRCSPPPWRRNRDHRKLINKQWRHQESEEQDGSIALLSHLPLSNYNKVQESNDIFRVTSSLRLSRPPATRLRLTGPPSSPRPSRDRTSRTSSPTSAQLPPLLLPSPWVPPLPMPPLPLPRRKRSPRRKRLTSIWAACSVMIIDHHGL